MTERYCLKCHTQIERVSIDEVKNAFRDYVIYGEWCPKCQRYIGHVCKFGGCDKAPEGKCMVKHGAPSCMEGEDGTLYWKCKYYVKEHTLSRPELEAGIV